MSEVKIEDLRVDEDDDLSEGWYATQNGNNSAMFTHEEYPMLEIKYEDGNYLFSSGYDYISRCVEEIDSFEGYKHDDCPSVDDVTSVVNCIEKFHEEEGRV